MLPGSPAIRPGSDFCYARGLGPFPLNARGGSGPRSGRACEPPLRRLVADARNIPPRPGFGGRLPRARHPLPPSGRTALAAVLRAGVSIQEEFVSSRNQRSSLRLLPTRSITTPGPRMARASPMFRTFLAGDDQARRVRPHRQVRSAAPDPGPRFLQEPADRYQCSVDLMFQIAKDVLDEKQYKPTSTVTARSTLPTTTTIRTASASTFSWRGASLRSPLV